MPTTQENFDALGRALQNNNVKDVKTILENLRWPGLLKGLLTATTSNGRNCLMLACEHSSSSSLEVMKLLLEKIDEVGGPDLLKSQFTATDNGGWTCLMFGIRYCSSSEVMKLIFEKIVEVGDKALLKNQLTATTSNGRNILMTACERSPSSSLEVMKLLFEKIDEVGDPELLKSLLAAKGEHGWTCLMFGIRYSSSSEIMQLLFKKIVEVRDKDLLKNQLAATTGIGRNCLMLACEHSSSPQVVKLVLQEIHKVGDPELLKSLLTATDAHGMNCLMFGIRYSSSSEVMKLLFENIVKVTDKALLKSQLAATTSNGRNCLMLACEHSSSSSLEVMKLLLEKIDELGGPDLLKSQFTATDNGGWTCLMFGIRYCSSSEVMKLIFEKIVEVGDKTLLKNQLTATTSNGRNCLMLACERSSSRGVMKLVAVALFHFDLFKQQYVSLANDKKKHLEKYTNIEAPSAWIPFSSSTSWTPDADSLAEVKSILQRADDPDSKKKAGEEAAVAKKKKAEEEAAAKKKAEEEAASKKHAGEEAAPAKKKKAEDETAAEKKTDDRPSDGAESSNSLPPSFCFKRGVPDKNLEDAVNALLSIKEAPPKRPDLDNWIPDKHDVESLLHYLKTSLPELKERPAIKKLIAENGLTDDDIKVIHSYKIQNPYPVYLWLNGWLSGDRRDDLVKEHVAPFFTLLYRAMEKLPRVTTNVNRGIKVNGIASLKSTFDNYETVCKKGNVLSFWGFSSFSTKSDVVNRPEFVGTPDEEGIVYSCGELEGVSIEAFAPKGLKDESELLPLCPCVLKVVSNFKMGKKLIIGVEQMDHSKFAYVLPKQ